MGQCTSAALRIPNEKRFRRAIKLYEVTEVQSLTNLLNRNKCFETGESPLTLAAQEGHEAVVQALVSHGADVNKLDRHGRGPLHIAAQINDDETVEILLESGANPDKYDACNQTPLHIACEKGFNHIAEKLLLASADANADSRAVAPLVLAVINGHKDCVDLLLKFDANPNVTDAKGNTALHIAVANNDVPCAKLLLDHKANPNFPSRDNDSLVCLASLNVNSVMIQNLVDAGCEINAFRPDDVPPLVASTVRGHFDCVDGLIALGADLSAIDKKGNTALHIAVLSVADTQKEMFFSKYFSNVYRMYSKFDPVEINAENNTKCAMSLVQGGADLTSVWERFTQIFPSPQGITFEQMVLCEVLIQAFGFQSLPKRRIRTFIACLLTLREFGLVKLMYSAGVDPEWEDQSILAMSADDADKEMFKWINSLRTNPRQLKDLCRQYVRRKVHRNVLYHAEELNIDEDAKEYLCIMDTEYYCV